MLKVKLNSNNFLKLFGSHGLNKLLKEPFIFHYCNLNPKGMTYEKLKTSITNLDESPIVVSSNSYLDHYPKNRSVLSFYVQGIDADNSVYLF